MCPAALNAPFAVVIPYYRGHAYIETLLDSIASSRRRPAHVIVVDNGPWHDRLDASALAHYGGAFRLWVLRSEPSIGFGRACNLGAYQARELGAEAIVVLNQDTRVEAEMFTELLEPLERQRVDVTGPVQIEQGGAGGLSAFFLEHFVSQNRELFERVTRGERPEGLWQVEMLSGACLAFRAELLDEVGLFDPLYHMYGEDNDLARRLRSASKVQALCSRARMHHAHSHATASAERAAQIKAWILESGSIRVLTRPRRVPGTRLTYHAARRLWHYGREVWRTGYDLSALGPLLRSDYRLACSWRALRRAARGEPVCERIASAIEHDRARAELCEVQSGD